MKKTLLSLTSLMLLVAIVFSFGACAAPAPDADDSDLTIEAPGSNTDTTVKDDGVEDESEFTGSNDDILAEALVPDTIPATAGVVFRPNYVYDEDLNRSVVSYYVFDYMEATVGAATDIYIPYTYYDAECQGEDLEPKPVVAIGHAAFEGATSAVSITLPKTLVKIGQYAFRNCTALASLDIPALVSDISVDAFNGATAINSFTVDDANAKYADVNGAIVVGSKIFRAGNSTVIPADGSVTAIGASAFSGLAINEIVIPDSITSIESNAFANCKNLLRITYSANVHEIPDGAFMGCTSLNQIEIPDWVSEIGDYAFRGCTAINTAVISPSVRVIGSYAFEGCSALSTLTLLPGVDTIASSAFKNCTKISTLQIPSSVKTIDTAAFWGCTGLSAVEFVGTPTINYIGIAAFYGCASLTYISLPPSICSSQGKILDYAFYGCCTVGADGTIAPIKVKLNGTTSYYWGSNWDRCYTVIETYDRTKYNYYYTTVKQV